MGGATSFFDPTSVAGNDTGFNAAVSAPHTPTHWYAVRTRPRHEKTVEAELRAHCIESFVPTIIETHYWSDRKKRVQVPVFPGYAFVNIPMTTPLRVAVLRSNGVLNFVGEQNSGTVIPNEEIECVRRLIATQVPFHPHPFLRAGQRVMIRGGSLDGTTGILSECGRRLVVTVNAISQSLSIIVNGQDIRPI
jgi:transcription antitermination factor NusG